MAAVDRRPDEGTWTLIERTAKHIWTSGAAQQMKFTNESSVVLVLLKGWELGLPLMSSLEHVRMIHGHFSLSAECQQALVLARVPGAKFVWKSDGKSGVAEVLATRPGHADVTVRFSADDALQTGLAGKNPLYKTYGANLLRASAMRQACRRLFPDILIGVDMIDSDEEDVEAQVQNIRASGESTQEHVEPQGTRSAEAVSAPKAVQALPPNVPRQGDNPQQAFDSGVPEDHKLPFTDGPWGGLCLSDLRAEDFPKMVRGFSSRAEKAREGNDEARVTAAETWLGRVKTWAAYRKAPTE